MSVSLQNYLRAIRAVSLTILFTVVLGCAQLFAQDAKITGKVLLSDGGSPVVGATVQLENTMKGTVTDFDGAFTLTVPETGRLKVTFMGYKTQLVNVKKGQTDYVINMEEESRNIDEVRVVGYGVQKKKEVTGAVARVDTEELTKVSTSDLGTALQGLVAGVNVQASSGEPGEASQIQIRGVSSISGDSSPLYVVDGIPYDGDPGLAPSEIQTIDVLKDAASAAVYGTRGAGGVILITTKEGKAGEMKISADGYCGVQIISSTINMMNFSETMYASMLSNRISESKNTDDQYQDGWGYGTSPNSILNDSDLISEILNNYALIQNYSINLSGGSKSLTYSFVGNLFDQEGVIFNTGFTRYNLRSNSVFKKNKWTITTSLGFKHEVKEAPASNNMILKAYNYKATNTSIYLDEATTGSDTDDQDDINTLSTTVMQLMETVTTKTDSFVLNVGIGYQISNALTYNTRFGSTFTNARKLEYMPLFEVYDSDGVLQENTNTSTRSEIKNTHTRQQNMTWENVLTWHKAYGKSDFNATGTFGVEKYTTDSFWASVKDLASDDIQSMNIGTDDMLVGSGTNRITTLVGSLARLQYSYDSKYMLSASVRCDGSSRFTKDNRWGMFPSVSAGWNISDEPFWSSLSNKINAFKFRASMGTTGNQNFSDYEYASTIETGYDYCFNEEGTSAENGVANTDYSNEDIKWETTTQYNIGLDAGFLKNKFTLSLDFYESQKKDMLFTMSVPPSAGTGTNSTVMVNVGNMRNRGFEIAAGYKGRIKKFTYQMNLTASTNENVITKMPDNVDRYYFSDGKPSSSSDDLVTVLQEGLAAGTFMVMPTNGVINTEEKLYQYQKYEPEAQMGDLIYVDSNGDGVINDDDRVEGGNGAPEFELGYTAKANFNNFDISINIYTSLGNEVINGTEIYTTSSKTNRDIIYQWSESNPTSNIPTYQSGSHDNCRGYADIWVEDGSFMRLKNLQLGYSIPKAKLTKLGLTKLRVYVAGDNLLTLTKYSGYDPEVGSNGLSKRGLDLGTYPITIQIRGGVQVQF